MAGKQGIAQQLGIALVAATAKTVVQIVAAANHPVDIIEIGIGFDGTNNTNEAVEVLVERQTDAGTTSALTPVGANNSDGDTFDTTARHSASAEPTGSDDLRHFRVHPQQGFVYQCHDRAPLHIGAADRIGIVCTAANAVNVDCYVLFEE